MTVQGVECGECKEQIWSRYTHDFRVCKCGTTFVDGGREYMRYGTLKGNSNLPQGIKIEVSDEDS